MNFLKFPRTPFSQNTSGRLLLSLQLIENIVKYYRGDKRPGMSKKFFIVCNRSFYEKQQIAIE